MKFDIKEGSRGVTLRVLFQFCFLLFFSRTFLPLASQRVMLLERSLTSARKSPSLSQPMPARNRMDLSENMRKTSDQAYLYSVHAPASSDTTKNMQQRRDPAYLYMLQPTVIPQRTCKRATEQAYLCMLRLPQRTC